MSNHDFNAENEALRRSWDQYSTDHLDTYLVKDIEDPRTNCQSILTRGLIVDTLWPGEVDGLINDELRFGAVLTWMMQRLKLGVEPGKILEALWNQDRALPGFVVEAFAWLHSENCPIPNYIAEALLDRSPEQPHQLLGDRALDIFSHIWRAELGRREQKTISILEPGCGSANDYRFIDAHGMSKFLDYTGFDISVKNIENAQHRFPAVPFHVASILDSDLPVGGADYVIVHDLFEHLSPEGLEVALAKVMELTRTQAWLHFFNLADADEHVIKRVDDYHWNTLSIRKIEESLAPIASDIEVIPIPDLLKSKFGWGEYYNQEAVTLLVTK